METINCRIKQIREKCEVGNKDFAKIMEEQPNTVNNWVRDGYSIGLSVILKIYEKFKDINLNWLLTGDGDMFKPTVQGATLNNVNGNVTANTAGHVGGNVDMRTYNAEKIIRGNGDVELYGDAQPIIEKLEIENKALTQRIADLEKIIDMKDKLISMLEEKIKS